ncbi:hypothetical protein [Acerihabitans arboris]|uniref:Uncharacterized protein n=1 Tax=Acerihabitans arboris TaxID=2691583 RepID=A0A845ST56_9GAMM|nr:hypothetical protein [Acerihabitans arboris]NDL64245.1 hypothetical protein [Acerihabitans arboris]
MSLYSIDITVGRIQACTRSTIEFILLVSEIETSLLTIRALELCGIPDEVDMDGFTFRSDEIIWIAEQLGEAYESNLIPDYLFQKYVTELILLGQTVDEDAWNYGFRHGVKSAYDCDDGFN